jgi:hypothetical protein
VQAAAPAALLNDPAAHGVAAVLPFPLAYEPAGASVQAAAPAALLNDPAGHNVLPVPAA